MTRYILPVALLMVSATMLPETSTPAMGGTSVHAKTMCSPCQVSVAPAKAMRRGVYCMREYGAAGIRKFRDGPKHCAI